jgi:iron(III) transport system substrate-binding protein
MIKCSASQTPESPFTRIPVAALIALALVAGCDEGGAGNRATASSPPKASGSLEIVVYTSLDEQFAREVLDAYQNRSGQKLAIVFDSEAGKTTGLVRKIEAEADRPRCDVFFSSELFNTILLARKGLLEPYDPPAAADIPPRYKDPAHRWTAIGLRGRVLGFDTGTVEPEALPSRWEDLARAPIASRLAYANPLFGTTRGHVAAMYALWGPERTRAFLTALRENQALMLDGNSSAVRAVMGGRMMFCATDTDDVWVAQRKGASMDLRYLDMGDGGTLLIPCSVALIRGGPAGEAARPLVDFLVSAQVERMLAKSDSRNIPVRPALREELGMRMPPETKLSFDVIADAMDDAVQAVRDILIR